MTVRPINPQMRELAKANIIHATYPRAKQPRGHRQWFDPSISRHAGAHREMRQGDEYACSCGARWPIDEEHPQV